MIGEALKLRSMRSSELFYKIGYEILGQMMIRKYFSCALVVIASQFIATAVTSAQNLSGISIGDDLATAVRRIGFSPTKADRAGPFSYAMWKLGDGNQLSVTTRTGDDRIIYMESDWGGWNGGAASAASDFPGFVFGKTKRKDIVTKLGGRGVLYQGRFLFDTKPDKSATFDTIYDIEGTNLIVDFITRSSAAEMRSFVAGGKTKFESRIWGDPELVAIIIATREYADGLWGERANTPSYRPVAARELQPMAAPSAHQSDDEVRLLPRNGALYVPVKINDRLILDFVIDSGATDVHVPDDVFKTLLRTHTISEKDFLGTESYTIANGTQVRSERYVIRQMEIGGHVVEDVTASVGDTKSPLLLGLSFLSKFKSWSLDNEKRVLVLLDK